MSYAPQSSSNIASDESRVRWSQAVLIAAVFLILVMIMFLSAQPVAQVSKVPITFDVSLAEEIDVGENRPIEVDVATVPAADTIDIQSVEGPATVVLNNTLLRIEPEPEADGTVHVEIRACVDSTCVNRTITAEIFPENDPPLPVSDEITAAAAQQSLRIPVLENDIDDEGNALTIVSAEVEQGQGEVSVVTEDTELLFSPTAGSAGDWVLAYVVSDGQGGLAQGTVTVFDGDAAPESRADAVTMTTGQSLDIEVLANDLDDGGTDALRIIDARIEQVTDRSALEVSTIDDARLRIVAGVRPGVVEVVYVAEDGRGRTSSGLLTVTIETVRPTAVDDVASVEAGSSLIVDVLANDLPQDGIDPSSLELLSSSTTSIGISLSDNTIVYEPTPGEIGNVSVSYQICNSAGQCDSALLDLTVESVGSGRGEIQIFGDSGQQVVPWQIVSSDQSSFPGNAGATISTQGQNLFTTPPVLGADGGLVLSPVAGANGVAVISLEVSGRPYQITVVVTP